MPGANLYILARKTLNSATLRRCVTQTGAQVYLADGMVRGDKGRRRLHGKSFAASVTTGKLRLARTGDTLRYLVAEGDSQEFIELNQTQFGMEPIGLVRVEAITDASPTTVIIRWKDLRLQAKKLEPMDIPVLTKTGGA